MTSREWVLQFEQIRMRYASGLLALDGVSLAIPKGAFVALVGPSGSGKSTLLRLGAGLEQPSEGRIVQAGDLRVGVVFQDATLMPWARTEDNVALPLHLAGMPKIEALARAHAQLDQVGLLAFARAYPAELSGGMRMRASLARALVTDPHLLLLDEPFGALDEITRQQLNDTLLQLWLNRRPSIFFITHSVYEAVYLAQDIYVLSARPGRLLDHIGIEAAYPRSAEFRLDPLFLEAARKVTASIQRGLTQAP